MSKNSKNIPGKLLTFATLSIAKPHLISEKGNSLNQKKGNKKGNKMTKKGNKVNKNIININSEKPLQ